MTEKRVYVCDICHSNYSDKGKAKSCEDSHKSLNELKMTCNYHEFSALPFVIKIKDDLTGREYAYVQIPYEGTNE